MKSQHFQRCQVETPQEIVDLLWRMARDRRNGAAFRRVIDLGAGDGRFAQAKDAYRQYVGIEYDRQKIPAKLPRGAAIVDADALAWKEGGYDLCIGNPPYIRHHHLEADWRDQVLQQFESDLGVSLKRTANVFVLFLMQALRRTRDDGLVVQLVPFEWVSRPSAKELRDHIQENKWDVSVLRFNTEIFPRVLTTASVTIIDKRGRSGSWSYGEIGRDGVVKAIGQPSGSSRKVLAYEGRAEDLYGLRGLSPGGQDIFVLTEEERLHFSLKKTRDVSPCVTSLRHVPVEQAELDRAAFEKHFVDAGRPCWLIRSDRDTLSPELRAYLEHVGQRWKAYTTCTNRATWWRYRPHAAPQLLFSSGFVGKTAKVFVNESKAVAVGSVYGIFARGKLLPMQIAERLRQFDFRQRVVSHSNNLKKVEVRQLNAVLADLL